MSNENFNRPSVIVFNPNYIANNIVNDLDEINIVQPNENNSNANNAVNNDVNNVQNNPNVDDNIGLLLNEIIDNVEDNEDSSDEESDYDYDDSDSDDSSDDGFSDIDDDEINAIPPIPQEEYLALIRQNYELREPTFQHSPKFGVLFSHYKTVINPQIYELIPTANFLDLFRDIFQDIFNRVVERTQEEFPDQFEEVKVCLNGENLNVNLQFLPLTDLCSELFLIELYKLLQSKRDIITSTQMDLSFTFLPIAIIR